MTRRACFTWPWPCFLVSDQFVSMATQVRALLANMACILATSPIIAFADPRSLIY